MSCTQALSIIVGGPAHVSIPLVLYQREAGSLKDIALEQGSNKSCCPQARLLSSLAKSKRPPKAPPPPPPPPPENENGAGPSTWHDAEVPIFYILST